MSKEGQKSGFRRNRANSNARLQEGEKTVADRGADLPLPTTTAADEDIKNVNIPLSATERTLLETAAKLRMSSGRQTGRYLLTKALREFIKEHQDN